MTIDEKAALLKDALERGAKIDIIFHDYGSKGEAQCIANGLQKHFKDDYTYESHDGVRWVGLIHENEKEEAEIEVAVFYDK